MSKLKNILSAVREVNNTLTRVADLDVDDSNIIDLSELDADKAQVIKDIISGKLDLDILRDLVLAAAVAPPNPPKKKKKNKK
jgi:hypothetical protein